MLFLFCVNISLSKKGYNLEVLGLFEPITSRSRLSLGLRSRFRVRVRLRVRSWSGSSSEFCFRSSLGSGLVRIVFQDMTRFIFCIDIGSRVMFWVESKVPSQGHDPKSSNTSSVQKKLALFSSNYWG